MASDCPPLLGADSRIGTWRVDEGNDGDVEPVGELHQANRLPIALGLGHAKIVPDPTVGAATLFVSDHHHRPAAKTAQPPSNCRVVAVRPITGQRRKALDQPGDVVGEVRPVGMARHLSLLPGRQVRVRLNEQSAGLGLQPDHFIADIGVARFGKAAQLPDLAFQFSDGLFKIEK